MTHQPDPRGIVGLGHYCLICGEHLVLKRSSSDAHLGDKWIHVNDIYLNSEDSIDEEGASV